MSRSDPIRTNYYTAVQTFEVMSDVSFYLGALLSYLVLVINRGTHPDAYSLILLLFGITVIALFSFGIMLRLYLVPRAEDNRRLDFFSSACNVSLIHQQTEGYYNNNFTDPIKRMAAQTFENSLFSKEIVLRMVRRERYKIALYALIWVVLLFNRRTELGWIVAVTQTIFSEQIFSKWLRLEWLRTRHEKTFTDFYKLFQTRPPVTTFNALALEGITFYETSKANAAIILSSKIFDELNERLSAEWNSIQTKLNM
ncbi:MAG: hypothetical protein IPM20_03065 [Gammaproteobacteria bacterium]|nr:hypothetical protein [Gammaproteobacteria bacterium]